MGKAWLRRPPETDAPDLLVLHLLRRRSRRHLPAYEGNASCTPKDAMVFGRTISKDFERTATMGGYKANNHGGINNKNYCGYIMGNNRYVMGM